MSSQQSVEPPGEDIEEMRETERMRVVHLFLLPGSSGLTCCGCLSSKRTPAALCSSLLVSSWTERGGREGEGGREGGREG